MRDVRIRNAIEKRAAMMERYPDKFTDEDRAWLASPAVVAVRAGAPVRALGFTHATEEELVEHLKEST